MAWTGVPEDGGHPEKEELMRPDGHQRDIGWNPTRIGIRGRSGDRGQEESMTTGKEGLTRVGVETDKEWTEGKVERRDLDQKETAGDYGR